MKKTILMVILLVVSITIFADIRCNTETVTVDTTNYVEHLQITWQDYPIRTIIMKNLDDSLTIVYQLRHFPYATGKAPSDTDDTDKLYYTEMTDSLAAGEQMSWDMTGNGWARTDVYIKQAVDDADISVQIEWSCIK